MKRFLVLVLFVLSYVLSSCAAVEDTAASSTSPTAVPTEAPTKVTATSTTSPTPLPTRTATVTKTPSPTPTPTLALPVTNGTPLPAFERETITAENFKDLEVVARYGNATPLGFNFNRLIENGKTAVVGMSDGLLFYDTASGQQTGKLLIDLLRNFDITPEGEFILALAGDQLMLLNRSGETLRSFDASLLTRANYWEYPNPFAVSSTGKWVAIAEIAGDWQNDKVHIFEDGQEVAVIPGSLPTFSPDDTYLAILADYGSYSVPYLYTTGTWEKTGKLSMCEDVRCALTFSPDSSMVALAQPGQVILYRTSDRKPLQWLQGWRTGREYDPAKVSFSADSQYVLVYSQPGGRYAYAQKPTVFEMNLSNGKIKQEEIDFKYFVWPDEDGEIRTFDFVSERTPWFTAFLLKNDGTVLISNTEHLCQNGVCEALDGRTLVDEKFNRYTIETNNGQTLVRNPQGETVMTLPFKADHLDSAWLSNGYLVANFCPTETEDGCFGVVYNPKGQRLAGGDSCGLSSSPQDKRLRIICSVGKELYATYNSFLLDPETGKRISIPDSLSLFYFSSDGSMAAEYDGSYNGYNHRLNVFDVQNKFQKIISIPFENTINLHTTGQLSFSPDKNTVVLDSGHGICAVNLKDQTISECLWMMNSAQAIAFSPDGKLLATYGDDGFIRVWAVKP